MGREPKTDSKRSVSFFISLSLNNGRGIHEVSSSVLSDLFAFSVLKGKNPLNMSVSNLVAETLWRSIETTRSVTDDQLSILHFLFGKNLERATRIVDQRGVKRISGEPSGRSIFQVVGESRRKEEYFCFAENYCACWSFFYDVVNKGEQLCCKHQLAARFAVSLGLCIEVKVSDEQLALLLSKL